MWKDCANLRGKFETDDEAVVMEKSIVNLIKGALLHHGTCAEVHIPCVMELALRLRIAGISSGLESPLEADETPLDRAKSLSWLHLLAVVPILFAAVSGKFPSAPGPRPKEWVAAVRSASIALALMEHDSRRWEALFEKHELSLWDYELVVRMHQSSAIFMMPAALPTAVVATNYIPILRANCERIYSVQPTNNWNLLYSMTLGIDKGSECQVLREALNTTDDRGDDQARAVMDNAECWTNPKGMLLPETYWPCLGVAARYSAAIKDDPSFAQSMMQAYSSSADLEREKRHVMCAFCDEMCYPLKKCSGCQSVGYCSKKCQIMDWKAGHKHACKQQSKPDNESGA
ncbi:hypothetical protein COCOBI_15-1370 [Coccomyxa sp. Obi]|nr:hypothetical protein COCOBI_15-1370 [Coccomyxa sp. Obi]